MPEAQAYTASEPGLTVRSESLDEELNKAFSRCRASLFKAARRFLDNAADAEDAVQDALLSAYQHIDQFRGQAQMSTWLTAIVFNSARMQLRRRQRYAHVSLDEPTGQDRKPSISEQLADCRRGPEDECQNSEVRAHLREGMAQLSLPLRNAFQLRDLDGLSTSEAAHILGVPQGTVKAQLARARAKLRRLVRRSTRSHMHVGSTPRCQTSR